MKKTACQIRLPIHPDKEIRADFDGGRITSDAGLLLFYALDRQHGFSAGLASCIQDRRDERYLRHLLPELVCQRVHQIVAGYEDCNDAQTLRRDPVLKTVCDRLPEKGEDLASQPTLSRLENAVSSKDLYRLGQWLLGKYLGQLKKRRPRKVVLDIDATDDPAHGQQEFAFYHGYYRHYILHPLLIFDADSGDLVAVLLRPGHKGAAYFAVPLLERIVPQIRQVLGSGVGIEIRADSGFATPRLYEYCEEHKIDYVIGISRNRRLERNVAALVEQTQQQFEQSQEKEKQFTQFEYQAKTWSHPRRVVAKVEVMAVGLNRRFVLTNREDLSARQLYEHYVQRGQTENFIKAFKTDLAMDRLSCHRFLANQFRLFLHALAYQMFLRLRDYLWGTPWQHLQVETLRRQLVKIGARIRETSRRIWIHLSSAYPQQRLFRLVLQRLQPT